MLDLSSEKDRIISAALALAAEQRWQDATLAQIAERAGTTLVAMREHFSSKGEILAAFTRRADDEMLRRAPRRTEGQMPRDTLFEVIMTRFDVLEPYKGALKSIAHSGLPEPAQVLPIFRTQGWMLEAAGISSGGVGGQARVAGLATVYASVFRTWLEDDDAGLARTMAALDRRLRRGQRTLERVEDVCSGLGRVTSAIFDVARGGFAARKGAAGSAPSGTSPGPDSTPPPASPQPPTA